MDDSLRAAIADANADRWVNRHPDPTFVPGELIVVEAPSPDSMLRRLVVVLSVGDEFFRCQLVTNDADMATDLDMRLAPECSGFPTELLAQPELFGPILRVQAVESVGLIDADAVRSLRRALRTEGDSIPAHLSGLPLGDADDPRRAFKESELDDLNVLTMACRLWLQGQTTPTQPKENEL